MSVAGLQSIGLFPSAGGIDVIGFGFEDLVVEHKSIDVEVAIEIPRRINQIVGEANFNLVGSDRIGSTVRVCLECFGCRPGLDNGVVNEKLKVFAPFVPSGNDFQDGSTGSVAWAVVVFIECVREDFVAASASEGVCYGRGVSDQRLIWRAIAPID